VVVSIENTKTTELDDNDDDSDVISCSTRNVKKEKWRAIECRRVE
jgi:hypothetical protein